MDRSSPQVWDFYIALEHREVDEALSHWGQYWRVRGRPPEHAMSLEGGYSGPQGKGHPHGWGDWETDIPPRGWMQPDAYIAILVESVMQTWSLERPDDSAKRLALKCWYVHRVSPETIRRRLRVKLHLVQPLLYDGRREVANRLRDQKKTDPLSGQFEQVSGQKPRQRPMGGRSVPCEN